MEKLKIKSVLKVFFTLTFVVMLALSVGGALPLSVKADTTPTAEVTGVQVRSGGGGYNFIVLQNSIYSSVSGDVANVGNYNTKSKVKIYTSATDTEGKYLTELCGTWWTQNLWGSGGLMLAYNNPADYDTYNGTTIYKITVEAGCELPCGGTTYVTTQEVSFINKNFGQEGAKNGASDWEKHIVPTAADVMGIQVRSDGAGSCFIVLQNSIYSSVSGDVANVGNYNTMSKVKIYTSATDTTGKYLTELCGMWWTQNLWSSGGLMLAYNNPADYDTYNGTTIYKITIETGCELPCGDAIYVTDKTVEYINLEYGSESVKLGAYKWAKPAEVTGVQVRSGGGGYNFIVLQNSIYSSVSGDVANVGNYNTKSKVKIYTSETDTTGKYLTELCGTWWTQNLWGSGGLMLAYNNPADYDSYNGSTIYKITVEAGCELPCGDTAYVTAETCTFYNQSYGYAKDKMSSANWSAEEILPVEYRNAAITGVQARGWEDNAWYQFLVIQSDVFNDFNDATDKKETIDFWKRYITEDKITIYTKDSSGAEVGVSLADLTVNHVGANFWDKGSYINFNGFADKYNGATIYKVKIAKDCQLPVGVKDGKLVVLKAEKDYTFINGNYGDNNKKFSANENWAREIKKVTQNITLKGVQMRGLEDGWYQYLVLQSDAYDGLAATDGDFTSAYTTLDKIRIYSGENDTAGKTLSELRVQHIERNFGNWTSGLFVNFAEYDSTLGGHQVYKVVIEQGCELLGNLGEDEATVFVVDKKYELYNQSYGYGKDKISAMSWTDSKPLSVEYVDSSVSGIQARGWSDNVWYQFLVIRSDAFTGFAKAVETVDFWKSHISEDKIKIYTKNASGALVGVTLAELTVNHIGSNFWDTGSYINLAEYADKYNGATIYKVEISEGCLIPVGVKNNKLVVLRVDNDYTLFNNSFGDETKKFENFDWSDYEMPDKISAMGTAKIDTVTNQFGDNRYLIIRLNENLDTRINAAFFETKKYSNVLDKILIYSGNDLTGTPVTLRSIWTGEITLGQYGSLTDIGFSIKNEVMWNGSNMFAVKILAGCEIPFVKGGVFGNKIVEKELTFLNTYYGLSGDIPGSFDSEYQTPRKYENFAVEWRKAAIIEYKVEGLEDVAYEKECRISGLPIDASIFTKDGYDLTITDDLGYTYYGEIVVPDKDAVITLKYTVKQNTDGDTEAIEKGCSGSLASGNIMFVFAAIIAAGVVLTIKKNAADKTGKN